MTINNNVIMEARDMFAPHPNERVFRNPNEWNDTWNRTDEQLKNANDNIIQLDGIVKQFAELYPGTIQDYYNAVDRYETFITMGKYLFIRHCSTYSLHIIQEALWRYLYQQKETINS